MRTRREADIGGILGETFALLGENAPAVVIFIAAVGGLTAAGPLLGLAEESGDFGFGFGFGFMIDGGDTLATALFQFLAGVVSILASYLYARELLAKRGRLRPGGSRVWAYIGLSIFSTVGTILGYLVFIVPGFVLLVRWSASTGYLIGERSSVIDSLGESWDATRGHGWPIFLAGLALFVGFLIVVAIGSAILTALGSEPAVLILASLAEAVGSVLSLTLGIAIFLLVSEATGEIEGVFA